MLSLAYLAIAVVDFGILIWAARLCARYRTNGLIFTSLPLLLLWFDNFTVGIGSTPGRGELADRFEHRAFRRSLRQFADDFYRHRCPGA